MLVCVCEAPLSESALALRGHVHARVCVLQALAEQCSWPESLGLRLAVQGPTAVSCSRSCSSSPGQAKTQVLLSSWAAVPVLDARAAWRPHPALWAGRLAASMSEEES